MAPSSSSDTKERWYLPPGASFSVDGRDYWVVPAPTASVISVKVIDVPSNERVVFGDVTDGTRPPSILEKGHRPVSLHARRGCRIVQP